MPLLISPIDGAPMKQLYRFGIEIDVCPTSGGIWLDRGELEKLMAILREESASEQSIRSMRGRDSDDDDDEWDDEWSDNTRHAKRKYAHSGHSRRHESKMSRLMEIFDF